MEELGYYLAQSFPPFLLLLPALEGAEKQDLFLFLCFANHK